MADIMQTATLKFSYGQTNVSVTSHRHIPVSLYCILCHRICHAIHNSVCTHDIAYIINGKLCVAINYLLLPHLK